MTTELPADIRRLVRPDASGHVDVVEFVRALEAYARQRDSAADLAVAGVLWVRAWALLREESARVLAEATPAEPMPDDPWAVADAWAAAASPDERVLEAVDACDPLRVLAPAVRRPPPLARRVTLADLARALEEARAEVAQQEARAAARRERARVARRQRGGAAASVLDEDPRADVRALLAALPEDGSPVVLGEAFPTRAAFVGALVAALQMHQRGVVRVGQEEPGHGRVRVARRRPAESLR